MNHKIWHASEETDFQASVASDDQAAKSYARPLWQDNVQRGTRVSIWKAEPGKFTFPARNLEEMFVVAEGRAHCTIDDGSRFEVTPGSIVYVPQGSSIVVEVTETLKKAAIIVPKE